MATLSVEEHLAAKITFCTLVSVFHPSPTRGNLLMYWSQHTRQNIFASIFIRSFANIPRNPSHYLTFNFKFMADINFKIIFLCSSSHKGWPPVTLTLLLPALSLHLCAKSPRISSFGQFCKNHRTIRAP